jgi:hypothetical protein
LKNSRRGTSDYGSDFDDEFPSSDEPGIVADKILNSIKSPSLSPFKSSADNVTVKSTVNPVPVKQQNAPNFNHRTERKRPIVKSQESTPEEIRITKGKTTFVTSPKKSRPSKNPSNPKPRQMPDLVAQKKASIPHQNQNNAMNTTQSSYGPHVNLVQIELLTNQNIKLIKEIQDLTTQTDVKMITLHRQVKNARISGNSPVGDRLLTRRERMNERAKKIKLIKRDVAEMYEVLDSTYKDSELVQSENKIKNQRKMLKKQDMIMLDIKKAIKGQNKFFKHIERTNVHATHTGDIDKHYLEAKNKHKDLREQFRSEDKNLKEQHLRVDNYRHKSQRIKSIILKKRNNECPSGIKQNATQEDIDKVNKLLEDAQDKKDFRIQKYKQITSDIDSRIAIKNKITSEYNKEIKRKEDEERFVTHKIKEFKRLSQANKISSGRKKKPSKSVGKKPYYQSPAKSVKKPKAKWTKVNNSKKAVDNSIEEEKDSVSYLDSKKEKYSPEYTLNKKVIVEQSYEEDDYGSEFDASISLKKETKNLQAVGSVMNASNTQETTNLSGLTSSSQPKPFQSKISSKPSFLMKRKF